MSGEGEGWRGDWEENERAWAEAHESAEVVGLVKETERKGYEVVLEGDIETEWKAREWGEDPYLQIL